MKDEKIRIELDEVEALSRELERDLEAAPEGEARPRDTWADAFRASGVKHAMV
jgi:hypothetical protein